MLALFIRNRLTVLLGLAVVIFTCCAKADVDLLDGLSNHDYTGAAFLGDGSAAFRENCQGVIGPE